MTFFERWGTSQIQKYFYRIDSRYHYNSIEELFSSKRVLLYTFLAFLIGFIVTIPIIYMEIRWSIFDHNNINLTNISIYIFEVMILITLEFYLLFILSFHLLAYHFHHLYFINSQHQIDYPTVDEEDFVSMLTRTVMEFSEGYEEDFNITHKDISNRDIILIGIIYKLKVVISNFILKFIAKKALTRTSLRLYTPYVAAIGTGVWDAFVFYKVIKDAQYKITVRYAILYLIKSKLEYISKDESIKAILARYYYYGEYNNNLSYLLHKIYKSHNFNFSKEDYLANQTFNNTNRDFTIFLFATKESFLSIKERKVVKALDMDRSLKKLRRAFRSGDYSFIRGYIDGV